MSFTSIAVASGSVDHGSLLAQGEWQHVDHWVTMAWYHASRGENVWAKPNCYPKGNGSLEGPCIHSIRYSIGDVQAFNKDGRDVRECCQELFTNWLTTAHGPTPKSYQTLQQRYDHFTLHFIFLLQLYWKSKQYTYVILCYHALGY